MKHKFLNDGTLKPVCEMLLKQGMNLYSWVPVGNSSVEESLMITA